MPASPAPTAARKVTATAPKASPTPRPSANTTRVSTSAELAKALKAAKPGQTIALADGTYTGRFTASASGAASAPITLSGTRKAVLTTGDIGSGYGLHVTGDHWQVTGLTVRESGKGIVIDGSVGTTIRAVDVGDIGDEGVHFRANSSDGVIRDSAVHDTGKRQPAYGEGVYIGSAKSNWATVMGSATTHDRSDRVRVLNNRISNTSAEGIDVKEGTSGGTISGNVFANAGHSGKNSADSWVDVKGNGYTVSGNSGSTTRLDAFQVHTVLDGWGEDNVFAGNTVHSGVPGFEVWVHSSSSGNQVACKPSGSGKGLTNIGCSG